MSSELPPAMLSELPPAMLSELPPAFKKPPTTRVNSSAFETPPISRRGSNTRRSSIMLTLCISNENGGFVFKGNMVDAAVLQPKSMMRPKVWDEEVEEAYRFQLAGYRDAVEYKQIQKTEHIDRWPHNGYVKKLVRRDGCFYYYNKTRECPDKEIHKTKVYSY